MLRTARTLRVIPWAVSTRCDVDGPASCSESTTACVLPPLPAGEHEVTVDGPPGAARLRVARGASGPARGCLSLPEG